MGSRKPEGQAIVASMKKLRELTKVKEHIVCGKCPQRDHCKVKDLTYTEYM